MTELDRFEDQLRQALRRIEPPAGLDQRILRRVETVRRRGGPSRLRVAAGVLVLLSTGILSVRWHQEQSRAREAEQVREQFVRALEITGRTLAKAEQRLKTIGVERIELREVSQ